MNISDNIFGAPSFTFMSLDSQFSIECPFASGPHVFCKVLRVLPKKQILVDIHEFGSTGFQLIESVLDQSISD